MNENSEQFSTQITLKEKLDLLMTMGFIGQSALGDDFLSTLFLYKDVPLENIEKVYKKIEGYIVAMSKSLTTPYSGEYLRDQLIPGYYRDVKMTREKDAGVTRRFILQLKPTSHVARSKIFPETPDSPSKAISLLSQLMRDRNYEWHPELRMIIDRWSPYMLFNMLTQESWYIPLRNISAWVKAGKPGDGSVYHVKIRNITDLVAVASQDAEFLDQDLNSTLDISWTKSTIPDYDPVGTLPNCRLIRMIDAIRENNESKIKDITNEVVLIGDNVILNYNLGLDIQDEEDELPETIVEL